MIHKLEAQVAELKSQLADMRTDMAHLFCILESCSIMFPASLLEGDVTIRDLDEKYSGEYWTEVGRSMRKENDR